MLQETLYIEITNNRTCLKMFLTTWWKWIIFNIIYDVIILFTLPSCFFLGNLYWQNCKKKVSIQSLRWNDSFISFLFASDLHPIDCKKDKSNICWMQCNWLQRSEDFFIETIFVKLTVLLSAAHQCTAGLTTYLLKNLVMVVWSWVGKRCRNALLLLALWYTLKIRIACL